MDEGRKRRRVKTTRFDFDGIDNNEQKVLQQVIKNSLVQRKRVELPISEAPTFYPTLQQFENPLEYIKSIRLEGEKYGICKIVPPPQWQPTCQLDISANNTKRFPTKLQNITTLQESVGFDDGKQYSFAEYRVMADAFYDAWRRDHYGGGGGGGDAVAVPSLEDLAKDYWDMVETRSMSATVEYGNDLDTEVFSSGFPVKPVVVPAAAGNVASSSSGGSASSSSSSFSTATDSNSSLDKFPENYYYESDWNLTKLPICKDSILHHIKTSITGVTVPWLYIGMLFSTFCWHTEDNYLCSINYSHLGAPKQWYGIPCAEAKHFEKVSKEFLMESFQESPDLLHHMTTQISPSLLQTNGIPVFKLLQTPGSFVVTFPKAYHAGFSYGFNCGEAVNFATIDWIGAGGESEEKYRALSRGSVFSHQRLLFTILNDFQENDKQLNTYEKRLLGSELLKVVDEELNTRPFIVSQGVKDIIAKMRLPVNNFTEISQRAMEYDDRRTCCVCNHICVFSAVICECDQAKVACIRHFNVMCKCSKDKKCLVGWASTNYLLGVKENVSSLLLGTSNSNSKIKL